VLLSYWGQLLTMRTLGASFGHKKERKKDAEYQ
jgi:hypothetical protein